MSKEIASKAPAYGGFGILDIAEKTAFKRKSIEERGHAPVSPEVAVALVIGDCGRDLLISTLRVFEERNVVPDIDFLFKGLNGKDLEIFSWGLGGVALGSIAIALEQAVRDFEWNDNAFITYFNLAISGIPLRKIGEEYKKNTDPNCGKQESEKILDILRKSNTFLSFFEDPRTELPSRENLPASLQTFLKQNAPIDSSINVVVPFFKTAVSSSQYLKYPLHKSSPL